jgi:hypothetical protein
MKDNAPFLGAGVGGLALVAAVVAAIVICRKKAPSGDPNLKDGLADGETEENLEFQEVNELDVGEFLNPITATIMADTEFAEGE